VLSGGDEIMEARVPADTVESSRSMLGAARILIESVWHWIAGSRVPVMAASFEQPAKITEETAAEVRPAEQINSVIPSALDEGEIQRRRNLVRMFFNDFWSGSYEKPAGFLQRLDQAEDYINGRLAANGEAWRLDRQTRVILGLPPRMNSAGAR
jgi:hypothetical protein